MMTYISLLAAIFAFSLIVVAHEAGHLIAAKKNGIFVIEFAIGMGPKLLSKKYGETIYSIRLFPIGGFCKMAGEDEESDDPRAFGNKGPLARFTVIIAGAAMNFLLGIVLLIIVSAISGYTTTIVETAYPEQPAYNVGIRPGDKVLSVDGRKIRVFEDILFAMSFSGGKDVEVITDRDGQTLSYNITPVKIMGDGGTASTYIMGISPKAYAGYFGSNLRELETAPIAGGIESAFNQLGFYTRTTFEALHMLITGEISIKDLSGFIGIGNIFVEGIEEPISTTEVDGTEIPFGIRLEAAFLNVLMIMILITVNLGIMNLLPFPALDGGRAVFILLEAIRRKPIDQNKESIIHMAGFMLLIALMVFVTYNDVMKVFING